METLRETLRVEGPGSVPEAELIELEEAARASWRDGPLLEAFARAWGAMGRWDKALAAAEEALRQPDAPMALVESLGEYEASIAEELRTRIREASSPPPPVDLKEQRELPAFGLLVSDAEGLEDAEALRQRAEDLDRSREERLEGLLKISPSTERYMLLGSMLVDRILPPSAEAWRSNPFLEGHDALAKDPEGAASKRALLARACVAFRAALEARQRENGTLDSRAWVEWALAGLASGSTTPGQILEEARSAERRCLASPAWRGEADLALAHADILLLQHLCAPKLSPDWLPGLAALYQGVQARHRLPDAEVERHLLRAGALLAFHDPELLEFLSALSQGLFARAQNMRV